MTAPWQDPDAQHAAREYAKYHSGISPVTTIGEKLQTAFLAGRESVPDSSAQLEAARAVLEQYSGWWDGSPEDSWRLERDMRAALGMPTYEEDTPEQ